MKNFFSIIPAKYNKLASLFVFLLFALSANAATFSVWPGETQRVEVNVLTGYTSPSWSTTNPTLRLEGSGFYRDVTATVYFGGTATVTCTYTYRVGTSKYQRSTSWTFTCMSNNVSVTPTSVTLDAGETKQLSWGFSHTTYMNPTVRFYSDDPDIASVSEDGIITAKSKGSTTVYVTSNIGTNSATCRVTVLGGGTDTPDEPSGGQDGDMLTVNLKEAGTLSSFISKDEKYQITELKVTGPLNGTDLRLIRDMAGRDQAGLPTDGQLEKLDLHDAFFVSGGAWYYNNAVGDKYYTDDTSEFPMCSFAGLNLTHIYLPKITTGIGKNAFYETRNLQHIEIPVGVTSIEVYNFVSINSSNNLSTISFPSTVDYIASTFQGAEKLKTVYCYALEPPTMEFGFSENMLSSTLYVPKGCSDKYWRADGWSEFGNIVELDYVKYAMKMNVSTGGSVKYGNSVVRKDFPDVDYIGTESFDITGGETVNLTITPDAGYVLDKVLLNGEDVTSGVSSNTLVISNIDEVKRVEVSFRLSTGIDEVVDRNAGEDVKVFGRDGGIVINGVNDGERIDVYSVGGMKVATAYADGGDVRVASLGCGIYVVKVGANSFKVKL